MPAYEYTLRALRTVMVACALLFFAACSTSPGDGDTCSLGTLGCACDDSACGDGLTCSDGMCFAEGSVTLAVDDERVRGCEVLLAETGAAIVGVDFGSDVRGAFVREEPNTAVVFIAGDDHAIGDGQVTVRFEDDGLAAPRVRAAHCTDRDGAPVEDAKVVIRG